MAILLNMALSDVFAWQSLGLCALGALTGMLLGAVLGAGALPIALLALGFRSGVGGALALLAGLYFGTQYGKSIPAILLGVPGGASAVATTFDGHPMAERGQPGRALVTTLMALTIGASIATVVVAFIGPRVGQVALLLGPAEYAALMMLSIAVAIAVAGGTPPKALAMVLLGLLLAYVGTDIETGEKRLTLGIDVLAHGVSGYAVLLGSIVFPAILSRIGRGHEGPAATSPDAMWPTAGDMRLVVAPMLRGSLVGIALAQLPMGALLAPFAAYKLETMLGGGREPFGTGVLAGVGAPEAANNAAVQAGLIPLLSVGFAPNAVGGMLLATLTAFNVVPGPTLVSGSPETFWGLLAIFWIASLVVSLIGLGLTGVVAKAALLPRAYVLGALLLIGCLLAYQGRESMVDVGVAVALAGAVFALGQRGFAPMPLLVAFLLGRMLEEKLRQMLVISRGSFMPLVERPICAVLAALTLAALIGAVWAWVRQPAPSNAVRA